MNLTTLFIIMIRFFSTSSVIRNSIISVISNRSSSSIIDDDNSLISRELNDYMIKCALKNDLNDILYHVEHSFDPFILEHVRCRVTGNTMVHIAAKYGHINLLEYFTGLRGFQKLVNREDMFGNTPLLCCMENISVCKTYRYAIVRKLTENGANLAIANPCDGFGVLHIAARNNDCEVIDIFEKKIPLMQLITLDKNNMTPFCVAYHHKHHLFNETLLKKLKQK